MLIECFKNIVSGRQKKVYMNIFKIYSIFEGIIKYYGHVY